MSANLTVILGAGAARDVVHITDPGGNLEEVKDRRYRPPTVASLFNHIDGWEDNYNLFPGVVSTLRDLRNAVQVSRGAVTVENFLARLKSSSEEYERKQFRQFPVFLQYLFGWISREYCRYPSNYFSLINKTLTQQFSSVAFVTLNYDLLFDQALQQHHATRFVSNSFDLYTSSPKWKYFKIHGSVNWGREIDQHFISNKGDALDTLLSNIDQIGDHLDKALGKWTLDDSFLKVDSNRRLIFPAISVPVGESKLNCPPEHIQKLKQHLDNCHNYLLIGYSAFDKDLLVLLDEKNNGFGKVLIVSESEKSASEIRARLMSHGELMGKLQGHVEIYSGNGFDEFMRSSDGLHKYLNNLS